MRFLGRAHALTEIPSFGHSEFVRRRVVVLGVCVTGTIALVMCGGGATHFDYDSGSYGYDSSSDFDNAWIFSDAAAPSDDGALDAGFDGNDANVLGGDASSDADDDAADAPDE